MKDMWPPRREDWATEGDAQPRPHGNTYWLLPGRLLAGEHPGAAGVHALPLRLQGLQAAGITCCIDLTGDIDPVVDDNCLGRSTTTILAG